MFQPERYVRNSFSITFPRQPLIRRAANDFEDRLKGTYFQPQIVPVPDDLDPEIPRIIFGSEHGFSQIVISQVSVMLNVIYSEDWQVDFDRGYAYLNERVPLLFDLTQILGNVNLHFCGLTTEVKIASKSEQSTVLDHLAQRMLKDAKSQGAHDIQVKRTNVVDNKFFSNVSIGNYRTWAIPELPSPIVPLANQKVVEHGIQVIGDFNDRHAFNERSGYATNAKTGLDVVRRGGSEIRQVVQSIRE